MRLKPEDTILVECSRLSFRESHRDRVSHACETGPIDWEVIYRASLAHRVAPLVYHNLTNCGVVHEPLPESVASEFQSVSRRYAIKNVLALRYISEAAAHFKERAHDVLLLKHAALATAIVPLHKLTMSTDIDLAVRPTGEDTESQAARYRWSAYNTWDTTWDVIDEFNAFIGRGKRRINLEIDNRVHHDVVWNGVIAIDFRRLWRDASQAAVDGGTVYVPDTYDMLILSAVSLFRRSHLRLRNVTEIHELVVRELDFDWDALARKARAYRCGSLMYAALCTARAVLETGCPETTLRALRPTALKGRAVELSLRTLSPCSLACDRDCGTAPSESPGLGDLARRFLALNAGQMFRYLLFRIVLRRVLNVVKH
jgi:hypothetical protein